ncbi:flagellar hook-length control protein FliK [Polynucleobacter sp. JS-Mosq-20-D10]|nr:flagellar hook-length control protein FliK [Polynucleobacter sp. JS-Mosq-20-D10]
MTLTPELTAAIRDLAQQVKPVSTTQANALEQLNGLVAQATQATPGQAPTVTLTPELASAIRDLAQQSNLPLTPQLASLVTKATQATPAQAPTMTLTPELTAAIRDLAQQSNLPLTPQLASLVSQTAQATPQVSSSDLKPAIAASSSTSGVAEKLNTQILQDRGIKGDRQNTSIASPQNMKNPENSLTPLFVGQVSKENFGVDNPARFTHESDSQPRELEKLTDLDTQDTNAPSTTNSGLARLDNLTPEALQKFQIKQTEASLVSGPLHSEIMSAAKSGGGRIMFELTPPEQGTIRIDLRINQSGEAHLIVEGASDATKSRLDQGGQNLKQEFAQMGLNLSLDLRQGNQSQQASGQSFNNARQDYYANQRTINPISENLSSVGLIGSGHNTSASGTVHLFA